MQHTQGLSVTGSTSQSLSDPLSTPPTGPQQGGPTHRPCCSVFITPMSESGQVADIGAGFPMLRSERVLIPLLLVRSSSSNSFCCLENCSETR